MKKPVNLPPTQNFSKENQPAMNIDLGISGNNGVLVTSQAFSIYSPSNRFLAKAPAKTVGFQAEKLLPKTKMQKHQELALAWLKQLNCSGKFIQLAFNKTERDANFKLHFLFPTK